jgi:hypothetical protein
MHYNKAITVEGSGGVTASLASRRLLFALHVTCEYACRSQRLAHLCPQLSWQQRKPMKKGFTLQLPVRAVQPLGIYTDLLHCSCRGSASARNPEAWIP